MSSSGKFLSHRFVVMLLSLSLIVTGSIGMGVDPLSHPESVFAAQPQTGQGKPKVTPNIKIDFEHVPGEVLVKFRRGALASEAETDAINAAVGAEAVEKMPEIKIHRVRTKSGQSTEELIQAYSNRPEVEYVEPNGVFHAHTIPNDTMFSQMWGLNNTGQTGGTVGADIHAIQAWDVQTGDSGIVVADIDTGLDITHPDLAANVWTNPRETLNGVDDDGNGFIDDIHGWNFVNNTNNPTDDNSHGTHTAGTIAASGNNGTGVTGVNWRAKIMPVKFLNATGAGSWGAAAQAILYAARNGARIANNSYGGPSFSQTVEDAIKEANRLGMLFVVAAGNAGSNNDATYAYPCNSTVPNVVCVGATDQNDRLASFSNFGTNTVHVGAPGVSILSTVPGGGYGLKSGTSMATPHVAGAASLILSQAPSLTTADLKKVIMQSADPDPFLAGITVSGGRLNINNALHDPMVQGMFNISITPANQTIVYGSTTSYTITVTSQNNFAGSVVLNFNSPSSNITGNMSVGTVNLAANGQATSTLIISASSITPDGIYAITIDGTGNLGETHSSTAILQVTGPDFTTSVTPPLQVISQGSSTFYTTTITSLDGFNGPVTLSLTTSDPAISGTFSPNPVTPSANGAVSSTLTLTTSLSVLAGGHSLMIQGTDGVKTRLKDATLLVASLPDLAETQVNGPISAGTGTSITIYDTVQNQGTSNAGSSYVGLYLSSNSIITTMDDVTADSADTYLGRRAVSTLSGGAGSSGSTTVAIPATLRPGIYYIGAIADYTNLIIADPNRANNSLAGNTISISGPDLVISAVSGPDSAGTGTSITISNTVQNQAAGVAAGSYEAFYLSTDPTITTSDIYLGKRIVNSLAGGVSNSANTAVTIPSSVVPGTYYIGAIADYDNRIKNENSEANNSFAGNTISISGPDLVVSAISGPVSAGTGTSVTISDTVQNQAAGVAAASYEAFYLSTDPTITTSDIYLGKRIVSTLAGGVSNSANTAVTIPSTLAPGTYYIGAIADYDNRIKNETSETNNSLAGSPISISGPDLTVVTVSVPTSAGRGTSIIISDTVQNLGAGVAASSYEVFYLSTDPTITTSDIYLARRVVSSLAGGASNSANTTITIPSTLAPGTYYIGAIADYDNRIKNENNEANNSLAGNTINIQP